MQDPYMKCYVSGRNDSYEEEIDLEPLVERAASGVTPVRELALTAATSAINAEMTPKLKLGWLKDNVEEIAELGNDSQKAYRLFLQGRIDALAHALEDDIATRLEEVMFDSDEPDESAEEDEEDPDEEDEGEDPDDDGAEDPPARLPVARARFRSPKS